MTSTLYTRPVDGDGPWQHLGFVAGEPVRYEEVAANVVPLFGGGTITLTFQMDAESAAMLRRWSREGRRRWVDQQRIRQQMRHVHRRAARRARRAAQ